MPLLIVMKIIPTWDLSTFVRSNVIENVDSLAVKVTPWRVVIPVALKIRG